MLREVYLNIINTRLLNRFIYRVNVLRLCVLCYVFGFVYVLCKLKSKYNISTFNLNSECNFYDFCDSATETSVFSLFHFPRISSANFNDLRKI